MASQSFTYAIALFLLYFPFLITAQQTYGESNCPVYNNASTALGYNCNGENRTCDSFLVYRTQPPYNTIASIASLFSISASQVSAINSNFSNTTTTLDTNVEVIIPVTCSCVGSFYQANTTYVVQRGNSYWVIANDTFEGLTTCNAIENQKSGPNRTFIFPNETLTLPLRCACPSWFQIDDGIRYLMSFVIQPGDTVYNIATKYGADLRQTLVANGLSPEGALIIPFTTLLVPLQHLPNVTQLSTRESNSRSSHVAVVASVSTIFVTLVILVGVGFYFYRHKCKKSSPDLEEFIALKSLSYDFKAVRKATDNFSQVNKLGQGGFGSVYKGKFQDGQEIAVKRLSTNSGQGSKEFKTEVLLVEKLQHHNLVKLLGFCLHGEEKLLIYELLPNASLDKFLLDPNRQPSLDWETRYKILLGIARGLLYLHEDSRLRIIHRDLKMSNVLLDENMNPKIADFGLARLVGRDQIQADTSKIAGTYGYMAPEYALTGRFSIMSDVYSFGVITLEIVSGQMCNMTTSPYDDETVCVRAWRLWKEGSTLDLVDPRLNGNYIDEEVIRCIHIGLLCIQEDAKKRPTMAPIVSALNGHHVALSEPEPPHYGPLISSYHGSSEEGLKSSIRASYNKDDISEIYPR